MTDAGADRLELARRWRDAAPDPIRPALPQPEGLLKGEVPDTAPWMDGVVGGAIAVPALLAWHGAGTGPWADMPPGTALSGRLLVQLSTGGVARGLVELVRGGALTGAVARGAARLFGEGIRSRAQAAEIRETLDGRAWDALLTEARAWGRADEVTRLELARSGAAPEAPPGTELLAVAEHGALQNLASDPHHAAAFDGMSLRWFGPGVPASATARLGRSGRVAIAVHAGSVYVDPHVIKRIDVATGRITPAASPGMGRRILGRERRAVAAFRSDLAALSERDLGAAPPEDDDHAIAGEWLVCRPTGNDLEAYEAFAHLGVPPPAALTLARLWIERRRGVLSGLSRSGGGERVVEVPFEAPLVAIAAGTACVHALERTGDAGCRLWRVTEDGSATRRGDLAVAPATVRAIRAAGEAILVHVRDPLGDCLLRFAPG
jgi:hypothetical protein